MSSKGDIPAARQSLDSASRRPSNRDRQYSAHVFASSITVGHADPESGISEPQQAHLSPRNAQNWPQETLVTGRPSTGSLDSGKTVSDSSSGISVKEVDAPATVLDDARAREPGAYRCVVADVDGSEASQASSDGGRDERSAVTYQIEPAVDYSDRIATKAKLEHLVAIYPLPGVQGSKKWLSLRYGFLSTYRRLHILVLIANLVAISVMVAQAVRKPASFTYQDATTAVAANLFFGTLMRHEHAVNFIFRLAVCLPHWVPLFVRRRAAKAYSYGGIHSACGISAFLWYIFLTVLLIKQLNTDSAWELQTLAVITALVLVIFLVLICLAHPTIRQRWHNIWEITHRFGGWIGVALVWAQLLIVIIGATRRTDDQNDGLVLIRQPAFWFLILISFLIIYPWTRLRRLSFTPERLSSHAIRLNFTNRNQKTCKGVRLSTSPLTENHGFATIPNPDGEKGFSVLASRAGDWTENLINCPPKYLWSRGAPTTGVARVAQLFKSTVIVATGSGIGPCMSWLVKNPIKNDNGRLIWSARFPEQTYGPKLMGQVFEADEKALVIDTKVTGRKPDLLEVVWAVYKKVGAEAVIVISNPKVTREVVFGLESRKVPAYGAIFDS